MSEDEKRRVREFFGRHARSYTRSRSHRSGPDLVRLLELVEPGSGARALDVATGPGPLAMALARRGVRVFGLDLTLEMGREFLANMAAEGLSAEGFTVGDSEALPFPPGAFDLVTCRRAAHHFPRSDLAAREFARALRPGGVLALADMTVREDPAAARLANEMERARDGSHQRALPASEWGGIATAAGLRVDFLEVLLDRVPWATWIAPLEADGEESRKARSLAEAADPEVAAQVVEEGPDGGFYLKQRVLLVAHRP